MGKSIRSKIKKRLRTAKRQRVDSMIITPREQEKYEQLTKVIQGRAVKLGKPKNAFKFPESDDSFFPQHEVWKPIDFRAQSMPMVGYTFRGNRRKYDDEQQKYMQDLAKNSHPEMQIMAGGGAVHAKTGKKVSRKEASLLATGVQRPETSLLVQQEMAEGAQAVAAAASSSAGADGAQDDSEEEDMEMEPEGSADHSRRPVLKDMLKMKRKAEGRARPKSAAKGSKRTAADVQAALEAAAPKPAAPKPAAPKPAEPAAAASSGTSPKKGKKKGRKSGGGGDEAMAD